MKSKKNACLKCDHNMDNHMEVDDYIWRCKLCDCLDFIQDMVGYNYTINSLVEQKRRYDNSDLR